MKRKAAINLLRIFLSIGLALILQVGVTAEEQPPPDLPGLDFGEVVVPWISPPVDSEVTLEHPEVFIPPGDEQSLMGWTTLLNEDFDDDFPSGWMVTQ